MRKLLVKLVAAETALLGWLTYWLFLVYANNPGVSQELSTELSRFPQISYTTIDISTIVIITIFSILLAVKFDRGLRPGMKLERALQMLENLMKRNLFLESQLAEVRGDKLQFTGPGPQPQHVPLPSPVNSTSTSDLLQSDSWEKAFRTPIEAGPPNAKIVPPSAPPISNSRSGPFDLGSREVRSLPVEPAARDEKVTPKPVTSANWEESPARALETRGIITPTQPPPRKAILPTPPIASASSPSTTRLPYIPAPAPKTQIPPSVTMSATPRLAPIQNTPKPGLPAQARPAAKPLSSFPATPSVSGRASGTLQPLTTLTPINSSSPSPTKPIVEQAPAAQKQSPRPSKIPETAEDDSEDLDSAEGKDEDEMSISTKKTEAKKEKPSLFDEDSD